MAKSSTSLPSSQRELCSMRSARSVPSRSRLERVEPTWSWSMPARVTWPSRKAGDSLWLAPASSRSVGAKLASSWITAQLALSRLATAAASEGFCSRAMRTASAGPIAVWAKAGAVQSTTSAAVASLLMSQRLDRMEHGRLAGGEEAKEDPHRRGEDEGDADDPRDEHGRQAERRAHPEGGGQAEKHAPQPPEKRKDHGLHEELQQDLAGGGADGHPDADLPGPFGNRDQHDVHDADTADQEADGRNRAQERRHRARDLLHRLRDLLHVVHEEVGLLPRADLAALAHERLDLRLDPGDGRLAAHADQDRIHVATALQPPLHRS